MKNLIFLFAFLPFVMVGQDIKSFETRLAQPSTQGARVVVEQVGQAAALVEALPAGNARRTVGGYRLEIFSDNSPMARERAYEAYSKFREMCADVPTDASRDIRYDSPKYTVRVGHFLTYDEAMVLKGRLRGTFNVYIHDERQMPLSMFAK